MPSGTHRRLTLALTAITCLAVLTPEYAHGNVTYRRVAFTGDPALGVEPGVVHYYFNSLPDIDANGHTSFTQYMNDGRYSIWSEASGSLLPVARAGDPAPGTDDFFEVICCYIGLPDINSSGQSQFWSVLSGPGISSSNDSGIWSQGGGTLHAVVREGDEAPGTETGTVFSTFTTITTSRFRFNDLGQTLFLASVQGPSVDFTNESGIWLETNPGVLSLIARKGDAAPDTQQGIVFRDLGAPMFNNAGQFAFLGVLTGTGVTSSNNRGIWMGQGTSLDLVARTGEPAPDLAPGVVFSNLVFPAINNAGQLIYRADVTGPGVDFTNNSGLWLGDDQSQNLLYRKGNDVPGLAAGTYFTEFGAPVLDEHGSATFYALINGTDTDPTNNSGIWNYADGTLKLIVREGDPVPGTEPGTVFATFDRTDIFTVNNHGQIAFYGWLVGPGVTADNNMGIFATDRGGNIKLIAREGDLFDVDPDPVIQDLRTIVTLDYNENNVVREPLAFNDAGQIAFHISFSTDSLPRGIFVATISLDGDLDSDGFVGINDLNLILTNWNQTVPPGDALADANGDNFIGIADLNAVLGNWNAGTPPTDNANIPEPGTGLVCLAGLIFLNRRAG